MRDLLKKILEELVDTSISYFKGGDFNLKRVVICNSDKKIKDPAEILNHTQNRFFNKQFIIDEKIPVEIIPHYKRERDFQEGDYLIDVGAYLKSTHSKAS